MQTHLCAHLLLASPSLNPSIPFRSWSSPSLWIPNSHCATAFLLKNGTFALSSHRFPPLMRSSPPSRSTHVRFSSPDGGVAGGLSDAHVKEPELELLGKPLPIPVAGEGEEEEKASGAPKPVEVEEALAPFLKFFKARDLLEEAGAEGEATAIWGGTSEKEGEEEERKDESGKVGVEYYEPRPGDFVVGVVVSGNEHKLDVNVGADILGTMLTKEVLPLYVGEMVHALCDLEKDAEEFMAPGKIGILNEEEALSGEPAPGRPIVDVGSVLFAEVLGRTLSGRPLLSTRRMFRRMAWHRVRQIKQLGEPIEVRITEWNTGGLLTRIEGLRAFLPKAELINRVNNFTDLKENDILHLQEGTLLEGTVRKIFPFGAQVRIGDTNRRIGRSGLDRPWPIRLIPDNPQPESVNMYSFPCSGLLHISNISHARVESVSGLLEVDEKVKVLVVKSMFPDKISLSIADLESEPGLFLSDKEKVFSEAEEMAKRYKMKLPTVSAIRKSKPLATDALPFDNETRLYSNWRWFKFENGREELIKDINDSG
ncbi:hypothetical protein Taro_006396 [Colocasia esculenta]|uniref:S1 motif domain-containing protein n=1 Tax=Colocasia esculenta TaxID=4460 RepID=A0A843TVV5_COLES|nr:hypothetical protein [Colocasia esculenta]